jgi:Zn-dependent peptidase ImmA (M78 family)
VDAHEFATEFLMPSVDVTWRSVGPLTWARLGELEAHWGVPAHAVLAHARRAGVVSATQHRHLTSIVREMGTNAARAHAEEPSLMAAAVTQIEHHDAGQASTRMLLTAKELRRRFLAGARG